MQSPWFDVRPHPGVFTRARTRRCNVPCPESTRNRTVHSDLMQITEHQLASLYVQALLLDQGWPGRIATRHRLFRRMSGKVCNGVARWLPPRLCPFGSLVLRPSRTPTGPCHRMGIVQTAECLRARAASPTSSTCIVRALLSLCGKIRVDSDASYCNVNALDTGGRRLGKKLPPVFLASHNRFSPVMPSILDHRA